MLLSRYFEGANRYPFIEYNSPLGLGVKTSFSGATEEN